MATTRHDTPAVTVDPVMLAVIQGALGNIQQEMTATLRQSGRSNVATIARDYSNAIFDRDTRMILQGQDLPAHLGSLMFGAKGVADHFAGDIRDGDVYYHNDPTYGGSHISDMCAYRPVFVDGRLAFWTVSKLHVVDAGGPVAGSYNSTATDMYAEGLRIPPIRLVDRGELREDVLNMILINVRTSENQAGDLRAQLGAVNVAARRLQDLCHKYGLPVIEAAGSRLLSLADEQMRALIAAAPDGVTTGTALVEDTGHGLGDIEITATVTVSGDHLRVELSSPPQIPYYINSYWSNTVSGVYLGLVMWAQLPPPYNEGLYDCVDVDCGPAGTLLNASPPAAHVMSTSMPNENVAEAVRRALSAADPRRAMAEWGATYGLMFDGVDPRTGEPFVNNFIGAIISGAGATDGVMDGWHMIGPANCLGALTNGDTEIIESAYPFTLHEYRLRRDSGGAGRWRGGCGVQVTIEPLADVQVATLGQGMKLPASGHGAARNRLVDSKRARSWVLRADGRREEITGNARFELAPGDRYTHMGPGGGGAGDPFARPAEAVVRDVRDGVVSVEGARLEYGVVMDDTGTSFDEVATAALRGQ